MFHKLTVALCLALSFALAGCGGGKESEKSDRSEAPAFRADASKFAVNVGDNVYESDYFGMRVEVPSDWYVMGYRDLTEMMGVGLDVAVGDDAMFRRQIEASEKYSAPLFGFFQYEIGATVEFNPNITGIAENIARAPGVKTGADYFGHVKQLFSQMAIETEIADSYGTRDIGGVSFDSLDITMKIAGSDVYQRYYAYRHKDDIIAFIQSYGDEDDLALTDAVIDTIRFDWAE